jgi:hypothetical protein
VLKQLQELAQEILSVARKCIVDPGHTSGDAELLPAPRRLDEIARLIKRKLFAERSS